MRRWMLLIVAGLLLLLGSDAGRAADEWCNHPANLTVNCDMNEFTDHSTSTERRIIANGWTVYLESGSATIDQGTDSVVPPSQWFWSDGGSFRAIMMQQFSVQPGATYAGGVVWAPYTPLDSNMNRQVGLDPTGGTNPNAATVVWSAPHWEYTRMSFLETRATASSGTMTIFVRVDNPGSVGVEQVFIDGVWAHKTADGPPSQPTPIPPTTVPPPPPSAPIPTPMPPSNTPDWDIVGGHFFTQAGAGQGGFSVRDDAEARFWAEFQRLGGAQTVGYPISKRFQYDGFVTQAFQKLVLQWRPEVGQAWPVNVFDELSRRGLDETLRTVRQTPPPLQDFDPPGATWAQVVANRQALLNTHPAIRARYNSVRDPLTVFGLPVSRVEDMGNHYAIRTQRAVFQQWKETVPWAAAGDVTIANGGDIAKELGWLVGDPIIPEPYTR